MAPRTRRTIGFHASLAPNVGASELRNSTAATRITINRHRELDPRQDPASCVSVVHCDIVVASRKR